MMSKQVKSQLLSEWVPRKGCCLWVVKKGHFMRAFGLRLQEKFSLSCWDEKQWLWYTWRCLRAVTCWLGKHPLRRPHMFCCLWFILSANEPPLPGRTGSSPGPSVVPLFDPTTSQASSHEVGLLCRPLPVWNSRKRTGLNQSSLGLIWAWQKDADYSTGCLNQGRSQCGCSLAILMVMLLRRDRWSGP